MDGSPRLPLVLGGIEASLRRLAHYDYWDDAVRRSVLLDAKADLLVYGMGEAAIGEIAARLAAGEPVAALQGIRGTAILCRPEEIPDAALRLPSFEQARDDPEAFLEAFRAIYANMSPRAARALAQPHGERWVVQNPPALPLPGPELDRLHELPFSRRWHPRYDAEGGVRALETVRWSLISHRGCCGECSFCSLYLHQGRIVSSRSPESVLREARRLAEQPDFKGTITDIGGPTLNLYAASCPLWEAQGFCDGRRCLLPEKCPRLRLGYRQALRLYREVRGLPRVKHVFLASGFRHDLLLQQEADEYLEEVLRHHVGGQLKLAPEHSEQRVLDLMGKPRYPVYLSFLEKVARLGRKIGRRIYLVNYFISAHPGAGLEEARGLAQALGRRNMQPRAGAGLPAPAPDRVRGDVPHRGASLHRGAGVFRPQPGGAAPAAGPPAAQGRGRARYSRREARYSRREGRPPRQKSRATRR